MIATRDAAAIAADEGAIDPWLKMLSFWSGDVQLVALSFYAVHPMSFYGKGEVSADFPGMARRQREAATRVQQIYVSGCSGNVVAGKYNTGAPENRAVLAGRLAEAMERASNSTKRMPAEGFRFRWTPLELEPRDGPGFTVPELEAKLVPEQKPFQQCLAAMGLSWWKRLANGRPLGVPSVDFGGAQLVLLPGESYVEYQLAAQAMRPGSFVCVAGYGDGATGYIPTVKYEAEGDTNLHDWCWVAPGSEARMMGALRAALAR